jgi:hypothetical protein
MKHPHMMHLRRPHLQLTCQPLPHLPLPHLLLSHPKLRHLQSMYLVRQCLQPHRSFMYPPNTHITIQKNTLRAKLMLFPITGPACWTQPCPFASRFSPTVFYMRHSPA